MVLYGVLGTPFCISTVLGVHSTPYESDTMVISIIMLMQGFGYQSGCPVKVHRWADFPEFVKGDRK